MSTILTAAGESLIARLQAEGKALIIDTMILANVPGQDHTQGIAPGVTVPDAQVVLRYPIPPEYRAYVNPNQVVYSAMLGSDMGDFTFNWQGLWCSEHNTLVAVATFPALEKRKYDEANGKTGNNLTRNFLLTFTGARELTGLTISADVWQLDFTVRLNGIDERERLSNFDVYGQAFFDDQGWLLQKTPEAYAFAPGLGYVGGIRAALAESLPLAAPESANLPQNVWLDVCLKPTGSDRIAEASPMLTPPAAPLADSAADETGLMHYRALVARIEADGSVTDLRPRKTSGALPIPDVATPEVAGTMRPDDVTCHMDEDLLKVSGRYAICGTAGATAAKAASLDHFALVPGAMVQVVFSNVNTAANPTLNVNGTGAKPITYCGVAPEVGQLAQGQVYTLIYSGSAWQIIGGMSPFPIGQYTWWEDGLVRPGFQPANANIVANFAATYPQMAAYLSTAHGAGRCFASLAEYEAAHNAAWATLADGSKVSWQNIGGVAKFFWNKAADTLLMPDLTEMTRFMAGASLGVGDAQGDHARLLSGKLGVTIGNSGTDVTGMVYTGSYWATVQAGSTGPGYYRMYDTSRVMPTGPAFAPRRWGALACAYLGKPAS
ncbi:phage tail protein [uncultured Desulfovibrio sp.]|uniref:phage tail protein n=1 Tax=uncultured Desulfovibrio sp. TaxID=167968 RepID=UPI00205B3586|nr:phage tail protein [uncultured Desulfovibrio sp.]DAT79983.1 MAG TPA: Tail fiber protein [Caudoviricetes sp.]